jgi:predicted nucleotidyltransferase
MKRSLAHLPKKKKQELKRIADTIVEMVPSTQMVILFGSHARGDWACRCVFF